MAGRQKTDAKRETILAAASSEFAERDFHGVLMDDVAIRAGVGKGTLYRYFPTKEELFLASVLRGLEDSHGEFLHLFEGDAPLEPLLLAAMTRMLEYFGGKGQLLTLLLRYEDRLPKADADTWNQRRDETTGAIVQALERGVERGELRPLDTRLAAEMFLGMVRTAIRILGDSTSVARRNEVADEIVGLFLGGVRAEPAVREPRALRGVGA